ncbi:type II toxin-antitoxin system PemK/MazF family toxin [Pediococcus acidilactici]|uniref:type II toxin-antitoxin system PemK/MazF family toxin n=1 Tax=Pediococcus acidilactici TaxID=1254 RepID=UPI000326D86B|nr:type II toxin-antitoxin system PemK/MazF family toxin [Pediococcus acidilactici]EOA07891.1 mRNA interferase ChpB [Pediococcus acidilactici D3]KAF0494798.1 type II toxin-antitoxin system PemK/MazF family toxin [Pediococcus acidilactici]MBW4797714.1 type II toxin-antitoxin system PemK/MazF family toxin [Pediococcus acidilactici]MBW9307403.1 type II toxin-antitoxin system PemK/MazF family toxin [Pediococcus acidilactici]MCE5961853.1 type II toxin-antitoxin system PemK/MazF family toxin [Pedioc
MVKLANGKAIYEQGDIIWINLNPTAGHEQQGRRPALVFSIADTQLIDGLMVIMPITSTKKLRTLSVDINVPNPKGVHGKILVSQVRSVDPQAKSRNVEFLCKCPKITFEKVDRLFDQIIHP